MVELLGVDFRTAPAAVRETLSFAPAAAEELLRLAGAEMPGLEACVLSTCNRSEFYVVASTGERNVVEGFLGLVRQIRPDAPILRADCPRYRRSGSEAVRHLVRVACGLDSQILGDGQILGQVKDAVGVARAAGTWGGVLERVARHALRAGKRARRDTSLGRCQASIGSAIAGMVAARHPKRIVIVGAGVVARDVGRHLAKRGTAGVAFVSRTAASAASLASDCGGHGHPWDDLVPLLVDADVVVAATAAPRAVLDRTLLDRVLALRFGRTLDVVDAGMPRNVEPGPGVLVVDIDAIREEREVVLRERRAAIPAVEAIVEEEVASFALWRDERASDDAMRALFSQLDVVGREAADQLTRSSGLVAADVERVFVRSFKRLVHGHMRTLRTFGQMPATSSEGGR